MIKDNKLKPKQEKKCAVKLLLCSIYLIVITSLVVCAYQLHKEKKEARSWNKVTNTGQYTYIEISQMSEKFAYYSDSGKQFHFVIEKEPTGQWHTYLIAIRESDYDKYKEIIDYTYERMEEEPKPIVVYGYAAIISKELKQIAIKNISNFVPSENEVVITDQNFDKYLTNSYLDTTMIRQDRFSITLFLVLLLIAIMIIVMIFTLFDGTKFVNKIIQKRNTKNRKL